MGVSLLNGAFSSSNTCQFSNGHYCSSNLEGFMSIVVDIIQIWTISVLISTGFARLVPVLRCPVPWQVFVGLCWVSPGRSWHPLLSGQLPDRNISVPRGELWALWNTISLKNGGKKQMKCIKILKYSGISRAVAAVLKNNKHLEKFSERSTEVD